VPIANPMALRLEKIAMFIILALIILVASFNIVISLIMTVMEKRKDIAILKAMGAANRSIVRIFVVEGLTIGVVGALLARGFSAWDAACAAAWLHGTAGDLVREELGDESVTASDVVEALPGAFLLAREAAAG